MRYEDLLLVRNKKTFLLHFLCLGLVNLTLKATESPVVNFITCCLIFLKDLKHLFPAELMIISGKLVVQTV